MRTILIQSGLLFIDCRLFAGLWSSFLGVAVTVFPHIWTAYWWYHRILYAEIVSEIFALSIFTFFISIRQVNCYSRVIACFNQHFRFQVIISNNKRPCCTFTDISGHFLCSFSKPFNKSQPEVIANSDKHFVCVLINVTQRCKCRNKHRWTKSSEFYHFYS